MQTKTTSPKAKRLSRKAKTKRELKARDNERAHRFYLFQRMTPKQSHHAKKAKRIAKKQAKLARLGVEIDFMQLEKQKKKQRIEYALHKFNKRTNRRKIDPRKSQVSWLQVWFNLNTFCFYFSESPSHPSIFRNLKNFF